MCSVSLFTIIFVHAMISAAFEISFWLLRGFILALPKNPLLISPRGSVFVNYHQRAPSIRPGVVLVPFSTHLFRGADRGGIGSDRTHTWYIGDNIAKLSCTPIYSTILWIDILPAFRGEWDSYMWRFVYRRNRRESSCYDIWGWLAIYPTRSGGALFHLCSLCFSTI